ncbi:MAG: hypothetical protein A3F04_02020 [Candidatus Chisholmbacteria bacterium RIFCSPHIGHO2_12_FULL_49_9]|uniref:ABC transporter domain-containing protein n=1 Tax=Candidatus Chisholmbacteria bacterium RIFCSPHIGHO2_01_FULL_52_32 TaxID=1797591 RepID=A0A1G1VSW5_9BACT|nr:MAG: hypothetical protein A2786_03300 [Candidatus Chisholmbacteria bacterium RIFCSPHIGHO2_01_FULL_52_32]OGY19210.1 MAG: hypothetical protein A3F04_02020 [Candidatus Chisholmbacteria bacterium RIFCSPHIGHO2_12_FULL_49_9]OGY20131.1 MAG: hypothetical protein A2900_03445 [Candidatus Chisholmbacteria bacterium RIFCSPLOWO2_01_FULL_50_28]
MANHQTAVEFHQVSKKFLIGENYYPSLREWIATFFSREFFIGKESFYALRDLNFIVKKGESVGFIGPNGAGKSTILKLIARVTIPTDGVVRINGKVTGLLELGAGFHPELTGRENIFFKGTILGMGKKEIEKRMDEIVAFADLGQFIDSPIKLFSSGMYARLGFAVAIHLDPEILLIDEILSVGDASFVEKCYRRIEHFCQNPNKTTMIVSHNLGMLKRLCSRLYLLDKGRIIAEGKPKTIIQQYLQNLPSEKQP